jgi:hypothetical protein
MEKYNSLIYNEHTQPKLITAVHVLLLLCSFISLAAALNKQYNYSGSLIFNKRQTYMPIFWQQKLLPHVFKTFYRSLRGE